MKEHIIINKDRTVVVPDSVRKIGIQYDHKVNTLTFDCPRYADDNQSIDLSRMAIYINFSRNDKTKGSIAATNIFVDPDDPEIMHFDFIITRSVTLVNGSIICLVCAKSTDAEGVEVNHWNSELFNKLSVGEGMEAEEELTEEEIDYITSLLQEINTTHAEVADIDTRVEDLEFNQEKQGTVSEVNLEAMTWTDGSYITGSGTIGSSSGYGISELVTLPKMSTLILDATGYQSDVAMIAKSDHTPLVTSVDGKTHYEYYTDEEIQVYISCKTTVAKSAKIVRNVGETLSDLERGNSELKGDLTSFVNNFYSLPTIKHFDNSYITAGTGSLREWDGYKATDFIAIPEGTVKLLFYGNYSSADIYNAFYDENMNFIKSFKTNDYVLVPENAKYVRCSFTNDVFNTIYYKVVSITDIYNLAINTIRFQGTIKLSDFDASKNIDVNVLLNHSENLGYYEDSNGVTRYFTATQNGTKLSTYEYKFTVPRYNAIVLDIKDSSMNSGRAQIKIKTYEDIKSTDIVLFSNEYSEAITNIGGLMYEKLLLEKIKYRDSNNDTIMKSICRFGESYGQPESVQALLSCQKAGFNYMRVNLQFTSDNIPVLWHDTSLNQHNKNVYNGDTLVPYSDENKITISETAFSLLNIYKYGSTSYNTGIPTLESILSVARKSGMHIYIEGKMSFTNEQLDKVLFLIKKYALIDYVSISFPDHSNALYMANKDKKLRIGLQNSTFTNDVKETFTSLKAITDNLYWWGYASMILTNEIVSFLSNNNIEYECGDFTSYEAIENYLSKEYSWYCTGVEMHGTISPLVGQYIFNNI